MTERSLAYIALGSNVGDREAHLTKARAAIAKLPSTRVLDETSVEETDPIGPSGQGPYLNQMIVVETELEPRELLRHLQQIENEAGRVRGQRWGSRTLDLDIVVFGDLALDSPALTVPHPELPNRDFWIRELAQLRRSP